MIWSIPTMWQFPELFLMFLPMTSHKETSKSPDIRFYLNLLRSGLWAWWAKLAYQVVLTIRGRLISPLFWGPCLLVCTFWFVIRLRIYEFGLRLGYMTTSTITKTYLYNFDPLKPHFYIVKLGFTGVYIIFLISTQKHRLWVLVRTASSRRF